VQNSVPEVEWLRSWLKERLELRPKGSDSLTYFASKFMVYRGYMDSPKPCRTLAHPDFDEVLLDTFPELRLSVLKGTVIIDGARYYRDIVGGALAFGI
jgi:hypothetical protein